MQFSCSAEEHFSERKKMKPAGKIFLFALIICFVFLFSPGKSFPLSSMESLTGLKGVEVLVEDLNEDLENFNLSPMRIQGDIEAKLRAAGIQVLSREENEKNQPLRKPYLYIRINTSRISSRRDAIAYNVAIGLNQLVTIRGQGHSKNCFFAPTWYASLPGAAGRKNVQEILDGVQELTEKFIQAYWKANRKE
jgi:hypothetical protein